MGIRRRAGAALAGAVLLGLGGFVGWDVGLPAYERSQPVRPLADSELLALPERVYDPAPYVASTEKEGPPGPVGLVFQGRTAREGFTGEVARPWYVVSARTGDYSRLAAPHLEDARGRLWLSPDGTQLAWFSSGGVQRYDTMTGAEQGYPRAAGAAAEALVWSPDSTRIAFGTDPVRVLDTRSGDVVELPLRVRAGSAAPIGRAATPAWTADGRWLTVAAGDALEAVEVESGRRRTLPAELGGLRDPEWSSGRVLAGLHPTRTGNVLRLVRTADPSARKAEARVDDASPRGLVIDGFWGWVDSGEVVLTGLRPETGALEQAMALSLADGTLRPYLQVPTSGENWVDMSTVSVAGDVLAQPTREFERPRMPWSPGAKLLLCMLVAVFPMVYFLLARRPAR